MTKKEQLQAIEDEWYVVRYSGETPEIAYNSAIYHLTRAKNGPAVELSDEQVGVLKQAAVDRFAEIVLRDLQHGNSKKSIYRGIERSRINYGRFCTFCQRQKLGVETVRNQAAKMLLQFLDLESELLQQSGHQSIINCTFQDLQNYAFELGVALTKAHLRLAKYCHD